MGPKPSKSRIDDLERQQVALMQQNAEMAKHIAEQEEVHKKRHEDTLEQMGKVLLVLMQSKNNETVIRNDQKQLEIQGVIYDVTQFVNKGGFGEVYKARIRGTNREAAIKVMPNTPTILEEIQNEIKFLELTKTISISNPPIIEYYGCKITNEGIFIAMELAVCDLLNFWFNQIEEKSPEEKFLLGILIIIYVLRALVFLEKLNIIHGDIKPQNLVVVQGNQCLYIKLIDFGTVEKMNTHQAHLTVQASKAHTLFFASPEFLKRDQNNLMSRRLHKKSDAWAAGVMFYILFFGKLPWDDQFDYENFCNDSNIKDIIVPDLEGYKLIIELLLKKNPDQRSSAKDTLMQIKAHPVLKVIVQSFEQSFYPVDDVCHIKVSNQLKQQLAKLARPGHLAKPSSTPGSTGERRWCRYGQSCYNQDRDHREEFLHPENSSAQSTVVVPHHLEKKQCRYGLQCFRKDIEHRERYSHPSIPQTPQPIHGAHPKSSSKIKCKFGNSCNRTNDKEHMTKFSHN